MANTGAAPLPDVGELTYNGVTFSCLFASNISSKQLPDNAKRTVKATEYDLTVRGSATLRTGHTDTGDVLQDMRTFLSQAGGHLIYRGRGFGVANRLVVNPPGGGGYRDIAWGPHPEILEFTPLGAGRGANIVWRVKFTLFESEVLGTNIGPFVQFNEEISIDYDDEDYTRLTIRGTMEIPLTRATVNTRTLTETVDFYRQRFMGGMVQSVDLLRYKVVQREFNVSRDRRTMEWTFVAEELAPMPLPPYAPKAGGTFSIRPRKTGMAMGGGMLWLCSLKVRYTIGKAFPRRVAWDNFLCLLQFRMRLSALAPNPSIINANTVGSQQPPNTVGNPGNVVIQPDLSNIASPTATMANILAQSQGAFNPIKIAAIIWSLEIDEGIHDDSKQITFAASWHLTCPVTHILQASGIWRWVQGSIGGNLWKTSIQNISGWKGNLANTVDPSQDIIVDLGVDPTP